VDSDNDNTEIGEPVAGAQDNVDSDGHIDVPVDEVSDDDGDKADGDEDDGYDGTWDDLLVKIARDTATTKTLAAIAVGVLIIGMTALGFLVRANNNNNTKSVAASASTTSTTAPMPSVAGQPCVAMAEPLPAGAPPMDIVVGPPPTSLVVKDIKEGTGATVAATDTVNVNYVIEACSTGQIISASYTSGASTPEAIALANVAIPGLAPGVTGMKVGGQRLIGIPSDQAFGAQGRPPAIAPDEAIWIVVDLVSITPTTPSTGTP